MLKDLGGNKLAFLAVGLIIGAAISSLIPSYQSSSLQSAVGKDVKKFYELMVPGSSIELVSIKEESGLYKVLTRVASTGGVSYMEAYVTKDGKKLSTLDSMVLLDVSISQIEKSKIFVDCLYEEGVRIYGVLDQDANPQGAQATSLQLSLLGRIYSPQLYVSCDGPQAQQCLDLGISQVPSIVFGNEITIGIKAVDWFVEKTGCKPG